MSIDTFLVNTTTSGTDITMYFTNPAEGISSIIISQGLWAFYTRKNYQGTRLVIDGRDTFGPGFKSESIGTANDRLNSFKMREALYGSQGTDIYNRVG